jgi:hypothetical protein
MNRRGHWQQSAPARGLFRRILADQIGIAAVLLFALLPTLTFMGHWDEIFAGPDYVAPTPQVAIFDLTAELAERAEHAAHCHTNLGSCSAQPMPAGVGLLLMQEALLGPPPQISRMTPVVQALARPGPAIIPPSPPPRYS